MKYKCRCPLTTRPRGTATLTIHAWCTVTLVLPRRPGSCDRGKQPTEPKDVPPGPSRKSLPTTRKSLKSIIRQLSPHVRTGLPRETQIWRVWCERSPVTGFPAQPLPSGPRRPQSSQNTGFCRTGGSPGWTGRPLTSLEACWRQKTGFSSLLQITGDKAE